MLVNKSEGAARNEAGGRGLVLETWWFGRQVVRDASGGSRVIFTPRCCAAGLTLLVIRNGWP